MFIALGVWKTETCVEGREKEENGELAFGEVAPLKSRRGIFWCPHLFPNNLSPCKYKSYLGNCIMDPTLPSTFTSSSDHV